MPEERQPFWQVGLETKEPFSHCQQPRELENCLLHQRLWRTPGKTCITAKKGSIAGAYSAPVSYWRLLLLS